MVVSKQFTINKTEYERFYSDNNFYIQRDSTDLKFANVVNFKGQYTYTETDIPIPKIVNNIPDTDALNIIIGEDTND